MNRLAALVLAPLLIMACADQALAHRPYFTTVAKIELPDGSLGEARLLNGDGIFGPDPVRVLILDSQGRLVASSERSYSISLACSPAGRCRIVDAFRARILELDAGSFRTGGTIPGLEDKDRRELWNLEADQDSWGFVSREPDVAGWLFLSLDLARDRGGGLSFTVAVGLVCRALMRAVRKIYSAPMSNWMARGASIIAIYALIALAGIVILASCAVVFIGGLPPIYGLLAFALGLMLFVPVCRLGVYLKRSIHGA